MPELDQHLLPVCFKAAYPTEDPDQDLVRKNPYSNQEQVPDTPALNLRRSDLDPLFPLAGVYQ